MLNRNQSRIFGESFTGTNQAADEEAARHNAFILSSIIAINAPVERLNSWTLR